MKRTNRDAGIQLLLLPVAEESPALPLVVAEEVLGPLAELLLEVAGAANRREEDVDDTEDHA